MIVTAYGTADGTFRRALMLLRKAPETIYMKGITIMKNLKQRIIAIAAFMCVAAASLAGCSSSKSSTDKADVASDDIIEIITDANGNMVAAPVQDGSPESGILSIPGINSPDPVKPAEPETEYVPVTEANGQAATEYVPVTEANGQTATEYVPVTEANGQAATEADGKTVTTAQQVTSAVPVTQVVTVGATEDGYVDDTQMRYIFWLDIADDIDYKFEGKFVKVSFKVKDTAEERVYPITIDPDLSTVGGTSLNRSVKVVHGAIGVGKQVEPQDVSNITGPVVYADKVNANKGDTVDFYISFDRNPGVAALMTWVSYDANALEWQGIQPCGEFEAIATKRSKPESGTGLN